MKVYHLEWPRMKHEENSLRGIRYAARHDFDAIDLDLLITSDGVVVGCHWDRPMRRDGFRDPLNKISPDRRVRDLPWIKVKRLRAGRWPRRYRISRLERLLLACARHNITALLEPKDDRRFNDPALWKRIGLMADDVGADVKVRTLRDFPTRGAGLLRADAAQAAGFEAWTI